MKSKTYGKNSQNRSYTGGKNRKSKAIERIATDNVDQRSQPMKGNGHDQKTTAKARQNILAGG